MSQDERHTSNYFSPLSQDQARGLPSLLASLQSMMDDSNLSYAILSCIARYILTSRSWSVLLRQHKDTSQPVIGLSRLTLDYLGLSPITNAQLRGLVADLNVTGCRLSC